MICPRKDDPICIARAQKSRELFVSRIKARDKKCKIEKKLNTSFIQGKGKLLKWEPPSTIKKEDDEPHFFSIVIIPQVLPAQNVPPQIPIAIQSALPHFDIDISQPNQTPILSLSCVDDTGAALFCGYSTYHLAIAKKIPRVS